MTTATFFFHICILFTVCFVSTYLKGQVMVFLFFLGAQRVPPLSEDFADGTIVRLRVPLMYECSVSLAEDHESIHWPPDVILISETVFGLKNKTTPLSRKKVNKNYMSPDKHWTCWTNHTNKSWFTRTLSMLS